MTDEGFERSADMRLVELNRETLGIPARVHTFVYHAESDPFDEPVAPADPVPSGTILSASIQAKPASGLIPGALVTVALTIANEGDAPATGVRVGLPLPLAMTYRPGTMAFDGLAALDAQADELFAAGAAIGTIEPGRRRTVSLKLAVEAAVGDILLNPHLDAAAGAVLGLRALRLTRGAIVAPKAVAERPFYEPDESEAAANTPDAPTRGGTIAVLDRPELPPVIPSQPDELPSPPVRKRRSSKSAAEQLAPALPATAVPLEPPARRRPPAAPKAPAKRRTPPPAVVQPSPVVLAAHNGPLMTVRIDRARLTTLKRLFGGPSLGMIAHYLVLNALATSEALAGDGETAIGPFLATQERLLSRALIARRLGKTPPADDLGAALPAFPPPLAARSGPVTLAASPVGEVLLVRAYTQNEIAFLGRVLGSESAPPFLKATQLFVGLCASDAALAARPQRDAIGNALRAYAHSASAEIGRIFLRAKLSRAPEPFRESEPHLDDAARLVLGALAEAIG